ncbi:6-pyruvoyl tetrahydrobiopterin synthase-like [Amphiura filiformis]|uniref:6-pyruvoyl tetrahydrobiopterin synthase-like n=1 Tax=Amphiura filiformis TaxID=82378 RepID=UPI003B21EC98
MNGVNSFVRHVVYMSRKEKFSAGHRLCSKHLTEEENLKWFGKCYNPNGHGHNYTVVVTLKGKLDPVTGMIINFNELSACMKKAIVEPLDHKNLNVEVEFFKDRTTTTENVAVYVWQEMKKVMTDPSMLHEVRVKSTDKNTAIYRGESC